MSEKIYCGSGKKINSQYGNFRKVSICLSELPNEHKYEYNGKEYITLLVNDKKEKDQYGKDVSVSVDTWKPEQKEKSKQANQNDYDDLPF